MAFLAEMLLAILAFLPSLAIARDCEDIVGPPVVRDKVLTREENNCWVNLQWAKKTGILEQNVWYAPHGLTWKSSYADYQYFLHNKSGNGVGPSYNCPMPCSSTFSLESHSKLSAGAEGGTEVRDAKEACHDILGPPVASGDLSPDDYSCWVHLDWAKNTGIFQRKEWYEPSGLTTQSSYADFQYFLHDMSARRSDPQFYCPLPCSSSSSSSSSVAGAPGTAALATNSSDLIFNPGMGGSLFTWPRLALAFLGIVSIAGAFFLLLGIGEFITSGKPRSSRRDLRVLDSDTEEVSPTAEQQSARSTPLRASATLLPMWQVARGPRSGEPWAVAQPSNLREGNSLGVPHLQQAPLLLVPITTVLALRPVPVWQAQPMAGGSLAAPVEVQG